MTTFRATYRLQLGEDMDFARARELVPYLRSLGVSHLYLSPAYEARAGSPHGYDVIDPGTISGALGGEDGLRELRAAGLGLILDVVPNHMAADDENRFWADPALRAQFFDVDDVSGRHRRFFDIDHLAGVRQEDPEVFETTHATVLRLVAQGVVDGLRIDHPDGLADPAGYLSTLSSRGVEHVWVEKILDPGESLRDWPVEGTVGYEFCNDVQALFVDPEGEEPLTRLYAELCGERRSFGEIALEAKLEQACGTFAPEVERLRRLFDVPSLEDALSSLPIYRTYVEPSTGRVEEEDRAALAGVPDAVRRVLLLEDRDVPDEFVVRFQQTTPPVMAKGVEDTAFYRYLRLLALNEVGGDPSRFGISVSEFHRGNLERTRRFPRNLLLTSTHDTKRSADARARLGALSGMPAEWREQVLAWQEAAAVLDPPDAAVEYLVFQTLVSAWPISAERLEAYLVKALREAKLSTNWVEPDSEFEAAAARFAVGLLEHGPFRYGFDGFTARVAEAGERAALGQLLLKLTCPGIPDLYQGDELWNLSLVDPDNRRPVDWDACRAALDEIRAGGPPTHETAKIHLIVRALSLRARRPEAFGGGYTPIDADEEVCAFLRGEDVLVAVTVRDTAVGERGWDLPPQATGRWRDVLGGGEYELPGGATLTGVLGPDGRALLERC